MAETFIFRKEWIDSICRLDTAVQDKIISDLARYGAGLPLEHEDDPVVAAFVESQKKRLDGSIAAYAEKVVMSKSGGRKATVDRNQIYELAYSGLSAKEVAEAVGCSVSTVLHSDEWKRARQKEISVYDF